MSHGYYKNKTVSTNEDIVSGFDQIPVHRPLFIYFEFEGLRPNIPHWFFFGGTNVTTYIRTGVAKATFTNAARNSALKEPGDAYINETAFPAAQGGPTSSNGDGIKTDAEGKIFGLFYLQSNTTLSWQTKYSGTELVISDVQSVNKINSTSFAATQFSGFGQYQNYWTKVTTSTSAEWVAYTHSSNNDNGSGSQNVYNTTGSFNTTTNQWSYTTTGPGGYSSTTYSQADNQSGDFWGSLKEIGSIFNRSDNQFDPQ